MHYCCNQSRSPTNARNGITNCT